MPMLPIKGEQTIVYGSANAGKTVHNSDATFSTVGMSADPCGSRAASEV
jgi:hypothetical protein